MHKTTLMVDDDLVGQAAEILGTKGIKHTIDAAARLEDIERAEIEGTDWRRFLPS